MTRNALVVACETYWGAVVHSLQAIAVSHGLSHRNHRDLFGVVNSLEHQSRGSGMVHDFRLIYNLHLNFYRVVLSGNEIREMTSVAEDFLENVKTVSA